MAEALPRQLVDRLLKLLEEKAREKRAAPEVVLVELMLPLAREEERPRLLVDAAKSCLEHARQLAESNPSQAYGRLWAAYELAMWAQSMIEGGERPHGVQGYWEASKAPEARLALYAALAAQLAAELGLRDGGHVETMAMVVGKLVEKVEEKLRS